MDDLKIPDSVSGEQHDEYLKHYDALLDADYPTLEAAGIAEFLTLHHEGNGAYGVAALKRKGK